MVTPWCVKVTCLPQGCSSDELADKFGIHRDAIDYPRNQSGPNYYAWVNGFSTEQQANDFAERWNNKRIRSGTIKCKVTATKAHMIRSPSVSSARCAPTGLHQVSSQNLSVERQRLPPSTMISVERDDSRSNIFAESSPATTTAEKFNRHQRDARISSRVPACRNGSDCFNADCSFGHPLDWYACEDGVDCEDFHCRGNHPFGRTKPCSQGEQCYKIECRFLHPGTRMSECERGDQCNEWACKGLHSPNRPKPCFYEERCYNTACLRLHPPGRQVCLNGSACVKFTCSLNHPPGRMSKCELGTACDNYYCLFLHPDEWDPCEAGSECTNIACPHTIHPSNRILNSSRRTTGKVLKSVTQRQIERQANPLPILASKDQFCRQLKEQRMLIVRAETGSGKSTQLPQYAAEYFGGLVVCTQPRVVAAVSLARRVANEYDGSSVGQSVGYQVGSGGSGRENNRVPGSDIMFMTDSALIHESQKDRRLSKIKVLIVDEAHERTLNTDIIIGIAKLLLNSRSTDFYVVIASATIDPAQFLRFFQQSDAQVLNVPGRVFDVTLEYRPNSDDSTNEEQISTVLDLCKSRPHGHVLVFLPGQREIEKALALFNRDIPDNCVALPLYGSLSPEEQDRVLQFDEGRNGERRMVVFCTNVAETSLTIKNVRLVIDSGWAKEARFDAQCRLTVIETVRISSSSANQRKGRAGRTAPGHCVRLYGEQDLTRTNIEPEIRRSSLDLVALQLLRLQLDPTTFPFIEPPENSILQQSLQLLRSLACVDSSQTITSKGELFAELGFDPRLSAFIVDAYVEQSSMLELVTTMVAILTAPGSLFFIGGSTKEEKQAACGRIAMGAQEYDSDLLYLYETFKKWREEGAVDPTTRTCRTCQAITRRDGSCRSCRIAHTAKHSLNNKILNIIEGTANTTMKTVMNKRWAISPKNNAQGNESDIIGSYLLKHFPEQHGHLLVPKLPNEGVCMVTNDLRARITNTSVYVQKQVQHKHFIAMTITKLSTGDYVIERLHPVNISGNVPTKAIEQLLVVQNVGWEWNTEMRKQIKELPKESWHEWLVYEYDRLECKLIVWGQLETKSRVQQVLAPIQQKTRDALLTRSFRPECGPIQGTFEGGLVCSRVENLHHTTSGKHRIDLQHVPARTFDELDNWLRSTLQVRRQDVREHSFRPCNDPSMNDDDDYVAEPFFVVFKSEDVFKTATAQVPSYHVCSQRSNLADVLHMKEAVAWGRQLLLTSNGGRFYSKTDIVGEFGERIISCKEMGKKLLPGLQLSNLPANIGESYVQNALGNDLVLARINILSSDPNNIRLGSSSARLYFNNEGQRCEAWSRLRKSYLMRSHTITIFSKKQRDYLDITAKPSLEKLPSGPQTFLCTTKSRREALDICSKRSSFTICGSSSVTVTYLEVYPMLEQLVNRIGAQFQVQHDLHELAAKKGHGPAARYVFTRASPIKTAMAASMLSQATSPIIIKLTDDRQKCLFKELFSEGLLQQWTKELKLSCEQQGKYGAIIEVYGPQIEQGQLMRYIADYSDSFDERYRIIDLSAKVIGYFGRHKAADVKLEGINTKWAVEGCQVTFVRRTSNILLYVQPRVSSETVRACEKDIKQLLDDLMIADEDDDALAETQGFARRCAFCRQTMAATRLFRICGHAYCRCALSTLNSTPMRCPTCQFRIHIQDIQDIFSNNRVELIRLCKGSIQTYLLSSKKSSEHDQLFCPNEECDGLIIRSQGYQTCLTCGQGVCGMCRLIDDELHEGRTCAERDEVQRKRGEFLPHVFDEAEAFARNNWTPDLPPIVRIDRNNCLDNVNCLSLQRFYDGVQSVGGKTPPDVAQGFFAFHGTSANAIEPICQSGFDPTRRRGQVYGPGEYFGVTAAVSHGYCKADNPTSRNRMMIIAFIIQCNRVKTQKGFCYIVNNPVDWSVAFNLPVAIVTYGTDTSEPITRPLTTCTISSVGTSSKVWKSPFRWHWRQDNGAFEPYNDRINGELEQFHERWKLSNGPSVIVTPPLVRYVDDTPQTYRVDFQRNMQTNTKTNYTRSIERRAMNSSSGPSSSKWHFRDEHHAWVPYDSLVQPTIERAYKLYESGQGPSSVSVRFPGRPESYRIDFLAGRQMNEATGEIRLIARE